MSASADISSFLSGLKKAEAAQIAAAAKAVEQFAAHTIGDSQEFCPIDIGALAGSGTWEKAVVTGRSITVVIGHNTDYAAAVHELWKGDHSKPESKADFKARKKANKAAGKKSKPRNPKARAKYLLAAMQQNAPKFEAYVAPRIKAAAESARGGASS